MKPSINNLNEVLTYQLEGLHDAEKKLQLALPDVIANTHSNDLKGVLENYGMGAGDKRIKLKRAFSYLLSGPFGKQSKAIGEMIAELAAVSKQTLAPEIKDVLVAGCLRSIISLMISGYSSSLSFALALELHPVADLVSQILKWESESDRELTKILNRLGTKASNLQSTR